ncbi:MAG: glutathione S-transferase family protein [Alphaproteobacteria bacterium]|nr:glutathione S-transferase family protein [Alphaproteobacteria bacterium]
MANAKTAKSKKPAKTPAKKAAKPKTLKASPAIKAAAAKSAKRAAKGAPIRKAKPGKTPAASAPRLPGRPVLWAMAASIPSGKVGLALTMMGVPFDYRHVDLRAGAQRSAAFLAKNRFGQVPVLEHDGHFFAQSNVILQYLADTYGKYAGGSAAEEIRIAEWLQWDQDKMSALGSVRFFRRFPDMAPAAAVVDFLRGRATQALDFLDRHLGSSKFIAGPNPTIADIAVFPWIATADEGGFDIARWPNLRAWAERFARLPAVTHPYKLMPTQDRIGG